MSSEPSMRVTSRTRAIVRRYRVPLAAWGIWRVLHATLLAAVGGYPRGIKYSWDAGFYLSIIDVGYRNVEIRGHTNRTNFFPFLSWVTGVVETIVRNREVAIGFVTTAMSLAAVLLVFEVARRSVGERGATASVVLLLAFPMSLVLTWFYSEASFVAMSAATVLAAMCDRPLAAGLLGAATAMTRPFGVLISLLAVGQWRENGRLDRRTALVAVLPLLGFVAVCFVQWVQAGVPLGFLETGRERAEATWGGEPTYPFKGVIDGARLAAAGWPFGTLAFPLDLVAEVLFLGLAIALVRSSLRWELRFWGGVTVALPLVSGVLFSGARYMLSAWPVFVLLGDRYKRSRGALAAILAIFVILTVERFLAWHDAKFIG